MTFCYAEGEEAAIEERRASSRAAARISETGEVQASVQFGIGAKWGRTCVVAKGPVARRFQLEVEGKY